MRACLNSFKRCEAIVRKVTLLKLSNFTRVFHFIVLFLICKIRTYSCTDKRILLIQSIKLMKFLSCVLYLSLEAVKWNTWVGRPIVLCYILKYMYRKVASTYRLHYYDV